MYLPFITKEKKEEIRAKKILSDILKIDKKEKMLSKSESQEQTINFLSEQMLKEVKKALR